MLSEKQLISILIVCILSIIFISWFLIVIRTLSYQKRVKEHVIDYEDNYISLIDKLINIKKKNSDKEEWLKCREEWNEKRKAIVLDEMKVTEYDDDDNALIIDDDQVLAEEIAIQNVTDELLNDNEKPIEL